MKLTLENYEYNIIYNAVTREYRELKDKAEALKLRNEIDNDNIVYYTLDRIFKLIKKLENLNK